MRCQRLPSRAAASGGSGGIRASSSRLGKLALEHSAAPQHRRQRQQKGQPYPDRAEKRSQREAAEEQEVEHSEGQTDHHIRELLHNPLAMGLRLGCPQQDPGRGGRIWCCRIARAHRPPTTETFPLPLCASIVNGAAKS
jgi:hypothetical protein